MIETLLSRKSKVLMAWLNDTNPLVNPTLDAAGVLTFENAAERAGVAKAAERYTVEWLRFDNADGTSRTSPTCVIPAIAFNGQKLRTIEGHAKAGEPTPLQKAFVTNFAFQCGYCTAGFVNEGQVLLERLARTPVARADVDKTITEALDGHICRCTGYVKYHEAIREVILADAPRYISRG
jgi:aerobic-type carbon monoxide dehydrogenase small subunit (CoxS/CutS family)